MINEKDIKQKFDEVVEFFQEELKGLKTGRANPALLEGIEVEVYGSNMPLKQLATISTADARSLVVEPWDKNNLKSIEKAFQNSDLGLNPANEGDKVRVSLPELTAERREDLVKVLGTKGEEARIALRNSREDFQKKLNNADGVSEDEVDSDKKMLQNSTADYNKKIEDLIKEKEIEVREI